MRKLIGKVTRWGMRQPGAAEEITGWMRRLSARSRVFDGDLALGLIHVTVRQIDAGEYDEALASLDEVVALHGRGHGIRRRSWRWMIARATWLRALVAYRRGEFETAVSVAEDAADLLGALATDALRFEASHAALLGLLAECYHENGRTDDAVRAGERAVATARRVHARGGECDITDTLVTLAFRLHAQARDDEAARYFRMAVNLLRRRPNPPLLAVALLNLGACLAETRPEEALAATDEAIAVLGELTADDPAKYEPQLDRARRNRVITLDRLREN